MRTTPTPLPHWLTTHRQPPYKNVYEICPKETYVFGTESLYGDWDAELLILAQDAGPADEFEKLRDAGHPHPFAHREFRPGFPRYDPAAGTGGAGTNTTIFRLAEHVSCTKLYGSALIGMCRPDADYHGALPRPTLVRGFCVRVLRWVIDPARMPNLRAVICLGSLAGDYMRRAIREGPPLASAPTLFHTPHPAAHGQIGSYAAVLPAWAEMAKQMRWAFSGAGPVAHTAASAASTPRTPTKADAMHSEWVDATFKRSPGVTEVRDSSIRAEMVRMLRKAGIKGLPWKEFGLIDGWIDGVTQQKVRAALRLLAAKNGHLLQHHDHNSAAERWRIAP